MADYVHAKGALFMISQKGLVHGVLHHLIHAPFCSSRDLAHLLAYQEQQMLLIQSPTRAASLHQEKRSC